MNVHQLSNLSWIGLNSYVQDCRFHLALVLSMRYVLISVENSLEYVQLRISVGKRF